ncbi:MAG: alpha/beta hydrolase [Alphaproteobacteria bacterium]
MPEVIFSGSEGRLEGRYHHSHRTNAPVALILHPHPRHGGTMNNKVVYTLYHVFARRGFSVLRFNFRGVGRSQGRFDNGQGELSDAAAALDWLQNVNINAVDCWVAGFSFGAWIGMQLLMRRPEIAGFVSVAPPANIYDFSFLAPCPSSGLIVHGTDDLVVPETTVSRLAHRLSQQRGVAVEFRTITGADHFFREHLTGLEGEVDAYLARRQAAKPAERVAPEP